MKRIISIVLFTFACLEVSAQESKTDSLLKLLKTNQGAGKVNVLNALANNFAESNPDTSIYFANQALELASQLNYKIGIADAHFYAGIAYSNLNKSDDAFSNLKIALVDYNQLLSSATEPDKNKTLVKKGDCLFNIGSTYENTGSNIEALNYYSESLKIRMQTGDKTSIANSYTFLGSAYWHLGSYPDALKNFFSALKMNEEAGNKPRIAASYNNIGLVYWNQGNFKDALKNQFSALKIQEAIEDKSGISYSHTNIGNIYYDQGKFSESLENYFAAIKIFEELKNKEGIATSYNNIGGVYEKLGKYTEARQNHETALKIYEETKTKDGIAYSYCHLGKIYIKTKNYSQARFYLENGLKLSMEEGSKEDVKECYIGLVELDSVQGNFREAFENYKKHILYRDSLFNEENVKKIVQTQMQYDFDKRESTTKAEHEKKEVMASSEIQKQKIIRNSVAGGTLIILFSSIFSFIIYRRKREALFKTEVSEVEMKALRAQMNPHFIFNSLNSIKRYMANNDNKTAQDYLTKFASVMRMILENSERREVPLQQDLKALELYMQLESLRMKRKFSYEIKVDKNIDAENTLIPPLILQPFVENSIWHGLAEKEEDGKISIYIMKKGEMLECTVEDNGVGRGKSILNKPDGTQPEKKSLGMKITKARIDILNKIKKSNAVIELIDLAEGMGMKVVLRLPLEMTY